MKLLAKNRRAVFDYEIQLRIIAGIALSGDEVKSIKAASVSLKGSYVVLHENEAFLLNAHVTPYALSSKKATIDPTRSRKLLLHRKQLNDIIVMKQSGLSVIPTALLLDRKLVKLEIGVGRGKKQYDKRNAIRNRDVNRELSRQLKHY